MAGLDNNMLSVIECLAKNKIQDAKNAAIVCCKNDTTKKIGKIHIQENEYSKP